MAGDWIKIEHATPDKPEVFAIAERLELDPDHVVGALVRLWIWADQQLRDGNARGVTKTALDRKANVRGFTEALVSVGWLVEAADGLQFINFDRHNGKTAKSRALTKRRVEAHRKIETVQKRNGHDVCNGDGVTDALPEKRREELKPPIPPKGGKSTAIGIKAFLADCRSKSEPPVPESDPVFTYADETGIPHEWLHLCWLEFVERNMDSGKRYTDWRKAFRNCVRGNWYKLWWAKPDGEMGLTTTGAMAQKKHREAVNA